MAWWNESAIAPAPISSMRAVFIGDSQTQADNIYFAGSNLSQVHLASPWPTHLSGLSLGRITILRNVGIGGQNSAQMLARFNSDVLALDPDTVFIAASINNTGLATLKPDIIEMVSRCKSYRSARVLAESASSWSPLRPPGHTMGPILRVVVTRRRYRT